MQTERTSSLCFKVGHEPIQYLLEFYFLLKARIDFEIVITSVTKKNNQRTKLACVPAEMRWTNSKLYSCEHECSVDVL